MNKEKVVILIIAWITATTVIIGELSFFVTGGISALSSDVGISGAWGLSIFIQFLYAMQHQPNFDQNFIKSIVASGLTSNFAVENGL